MDSNFGIAALVGLATVFSVARLHWTNKKLNKILLNSVVEKFGA